MLTELQKLALGVAYIKTDAAIGMINQHKFKHNALSDKIREVRSQSKEYREDPKLLELHELIDKLMFDLSTEGLSDACNWLNKLDK